MNNYTAESLKVCRLADIARLLNSLETLTDEAIADAGYWKAEARKAQTERNALDAQNLALLRELRETLRDIETWDGTPDAHAVILENLRAAITTAEGLS